VPGALGCDEPADARIGDIPIGEDDGNIGEDVDGGSGLLRRDGQGHRVWSPHDGEVGGGCVVPNLTICRTRTKGYRAGEGKLRGRVRGHVHDPPIELGISLALVTLMLVMSTVTEPWVTELPEIVIDPTRWWYGDGGRLRPMSTSCTRYPTTEPAPTFHVPSMEEEGGRTTRRGCRCRGPALVSSAR